MTSVLMKRGNLEMETHTRRKPHEDKGRNWADTSTSQRTQKIASKPPEGDKRQGTGPSSQPAQEPTLSIP